MMQLVLDWAGDNGNLLAAMSALSLMAFAGTLFAAPWLIALMPSDYFSRAEVPPNQMGLLRLSVSIVRNLIGLTLMIIGLVMLVAPGPGLIVFLLGLSACAFPGKHRLMARMAAHPKVFSSLNWIRQRRGQAPFVHPLAADTL